MKAGGCLEWVESEEEDVGVGRERNEKGERI